MGIIVPDGTPKQDDEGKRSDEQVVLAEHAFVPVAGHADDDECTHRPDGTDATYCGQSRAWHDHHPNCYQNTGTPDDLPDDLCDCRILRMIDTSTRPGMRPGGDA